MPAREPLWVTGFPLGDVPGLSQRALVVFFAVAGAVAAAGRWRACCPACATGPWWPPTCRSRSPTPAARTTRWSGSTRRSPGSPATRRTRSSGATAGFLQGPNTDRGRGGGAAPALRRRQPITEVLLNYRRDGTAFWNEVSISPVLRRRRRAGQLRRRADRRHRAGHGRAGAAGRAGRGRGGPRPAAAAGRGDHPDDRRAGRRRRAAGGWPAAWCPALADLCAVDVLDRPGRGAARLAVAARDPPTRPGCASWPRCATTARRRRATPAGCWPAAAGARPGAARARRRTATRTTRRRGAVYDALRLRSVMVGAAAGPRPGARRADAAHPAPLRPPLRRRATCTWPPTSPGGPGWPSTTPGSTRPSTRPRPRCSAACCRRCPTCRGCRWRPATWSAWTATRSAATGTTC